MAVGTPTLFGSAGAAASSATTASATPTANALLIAFCAARPAAGNIPTVSDSLGGTWTAVHADSDQESGQINANLFYQVVSGSPSAMTVTAASGGSPTQTGIHVIEITGAGTDFTNFQFNINGSGDPAVTMASFSTGGICLGFLAGNAGGGATTPPTGHTELLDSLITTNLRMDSSYDTSSPGTSLTWSSASTDSVGYGLEIKEASATQNITGALFTDGDTFYGATVTPGAVAITGALYTDTDTFYGSTVGRGTVTISGALVTDADTFYGATLTPGGVTITGALYTDADTFYGATIVADGGAQGITGELFANTSVFYGATVAAATTATATSAGSYNMYRLPDEPKKKLRKIKYVGPANERMAFYVESTPANRWIPTTIYKPSVLEEIERNGLMVRQINAAKLRRIIMADDEWFMLN